MKIVKYINKFLPLLKKRSEKNIIKNVLVVSNTGIGDTVLATPAIKTLRKSFPELKITFLIHKKMYPMFEEFSYVDDFLLYSRGFINQIKLIKKLRDKKIDTIFLFHSNGPEDIFFSILSGANNILKMTDNLNHEYKTIFLNTLENNNRHIIERKIDLVKVFNPKIISTKMELPKKFYKSKNIYKKDILYQYIGLQIGAQDNYKIWPIEKFIALTKNLLSKKNCKVVILGSTSLETKLATLLLNTLDNNVNIINKCGKSTIEELPYLIYDLDLLITNDTGAMHLAIALNTPTISLFGPTNSKTYGPNQDFNIHDIIQKDGYFVNNVLKKKRTTDGMDLINVEEVTSLINKRISFTDKTMQGIK